MNRVKVVVLMGTLMMSKASFAQDNNSEPRIAFELVREGDTAAVLIRATADPVDHPASRGLVWEQFVQPEDGGDGYYTSLTEAPCEASKPPIKVSKEGVRFEAPATSGSGRLVLRPVAVIGVGCSEVLPMPIGGCTEMRSEIGPNITLASRESGH